MRKILKYNELELLEDQGTSIARWENVLSADESSHTSHVEIFTNYNHIYFAEMLFLQAIKGQFVPLLFF
jgi:hypothetical protein